MSQGISSAVGGTAAASRVYLSGERESGTVSGYNAPLLFQLEAVALGVYCLT